MTTFWILAAGLIGLALLFVLPPVLGKKPPKKAELNENQINLAVFRQQLEELDADLAAGNLDQDQYDASRRDLEKELLLDVDDGASADTAEKSGRWAAPALSIAVPVLAIGMYLYVGDQSALNPAPETAETAAAGHPGGEKLPPMDELVARLAERMAAEPDNVEGWVMLGRSYLAMGDAQKAANAYLEAKTRAPDEPDILLGYAEALAKVGGSLQGEPAKWIESALELAPANPNALWMMGLVKYQAKDFANALEHWNKLDAMLPPNGEDAEALHGIMADARANLGITEPTVAQVQTPAAATTAPQPAPAGGKSVQVTVSVAEDLQGRFSPDDTVFIFARALSGPPMPLAARRMQARDLPVNLTLDDSMAMMPQMKLSSFAQVLVGARISKSGNAIPQSGDLFGEVSPVTPGQSVAVEVRIDGVRP